MDSHQKYRLADTLNPLNYSERLFILELCLSDNRSNLQRVSYHLEILRERRWPTERSELQIFQEWKRQLEESKHELRQIRDCHRMMMEPERSSSQQSETATRDENRWAIFLRRFGIIV
ncbi:uncharacterized protein EAE98_011371 [Botrytis deweyae]|uniref:Uncharacterized protein n=1 Tax=Botrytis deweyae TaxID=2478750 RepID=A0ABQ7I697_9HELO|nr:uncharacterized protein EAE98_011371 [Botrytis deweyae]KAF7915048.1 hypothetical protein EAE98_011371 [Botrytis deweyae]